MTCFWSEHDGAAWSRRWPGNVFFPQFRPIGRAFLNGGCETGQGGHTSPPLQMSQKVKVAVLGASGYSGIELLRLLLRHPHAELVAVTSRTLAGKALSAEFPRFRKVGVADTLTFTNPDVETLKASGAEIAFLALPHGVSVEYA